MQWQSSPRPFAPSTQNDDGANIMTFGWLLFSFEGRINRMQYWMSWIVFVPLSLMAMAIANNEEIPELYRVIVVLVMAWPMLAVQTKRWHDIDMSGWWLLVILLPVVGAPIALVMNGFLPGTHGENRFGPATRQLQRKPAQRPFGLSMRNDAGKQTMDEKHLKAVESGYRVSVSRPLYPQFG
jgi:uncharacterized membrane protein YhaH (DUF805 family)